MDFLNASDVIHGLSSISLLLVCGGGILLLLAIYVGWARDLFLYALPNKWRKNPLEKLDHFGRAFNRLYKDKNWQEWTREGTETVHYRPGYPSTCMVPDESIREDIAKEERLPDENRRGHYKFHNGECIIIEAHNPLAAIAYELEQLLGLEAEHPVDRPIQAATAPPLRPELILEGNPFIMKRETPS